MKSVANSGVNTSVCHPFQNIPAELRALPQWVCWHYEERKGKQSKPPIQAKSNGKLLKAQTDNPATWADFETAVAAAVRLNLEGVGLNLWESDGLTGLDLDHVFDPATGELDPLAIEVLARFAGTYAEISPSGTGIRIWCYGKPGRSGKIGGKVKWLEVYSHPSHRYLTVTGNQWPGSADAVTEQQDALDWLHGRFMSKGKDDSTGQGEGAAKARSNAPPSVETSLSLDDTALIDKARQAANGAVFEALWRGDLSGHGGDHSSADLALLNVLAFWTGNDAARMDRLFRQSGLMRDKWDVVHDPATGRTYGGMSIDKAIAGCRETYSGKRPDGGQQQTRQEKAARPAGDDAPGTGLNPYRGTDDANADLLLGIHGADIRYCPPWDKWLLWSGSHWRIDTRLDIDRLSADVPRSLRTRAITLTQEQQSLLERMAALLSRINADPAQRQGLTKEHSRLLERKTAIDDEVDWLLKLAGKLEGTAKRGCMLLATRHKVVVHHSDLDKGHFLLNASNGTVDLQSGKLRAHERRDLLTHDVEIPFDLATAAPTWLQFLNSTFSGDADLIGFVQRAVGYSLTGDVREQVLLICHGVGSNGKSVFLNILQKLLGALAFQAAPDLLMADKQRRHPTEQADLFGKRLVVCQETGEGRRFNETLVKQLTGGDTITARRMHEDFWQFKPTHKLWLSTNHKPEIRGTDHAIWRRIRLIPFNVTFTDDGPARKDPDMEAKLTAELPGILAWAIAGCLDWQRYGLRPPAAVAEATAGYQAEMDVLAAWLGECCIVGKRYEAKAADLYASYCRWCEQSGERPETQRKWGMRLTERGFLREQRRVGIVYLGIGVVDHREPCEPCEPEKAIFSLLDFSKSSYGKTAVEGSQGSHHSQTTPPPVESVPDVEEF
ncbi:MAG: putative primase/helicase [Pseudomonadota bacterium]|nr:putative primase/helicase [Pseudomonadota bacterium]